MSEKMDISIIAHLILLAIVSALVFWILSSTFDTFAFLIRIVVTGAIIAINPKLLSRVESECAIQYYMVILIATVLFSVDCCNKDTDLILLLVLVAGVTMVSLYVGEKSMLYLSVFLNTYAITRIGSIIWKQSSCANNIW